MRCRADKRMHCVDFAARFGSNLARCRERAKLSQEELGFRAHDPEALAEVAIRVLSDDELGRRLVAEAYEHIRRFDWGDVAEQTAAVYADLVGEVRPA